MNSHRGRPGAAESRQSFPERCLHLIVLSSLAIAQPLLDVLGRNVEFFVIRRFDRVELVALIVVLLLAVPLPFMLIEASLVRVPWRAQRAVHLAFIWFFVALLALIVVRRLDVAQAVVPIAIAVLLSSICTVVYARSKGMKSFVSLLAIGLVAIPMVFAVNPQIWRLLSLRTATNLELAGVKNRAPIVFIVFDEFNLLVLLDRKFQINRHRYPHLAALSDRSTWFRNAIAAAESTADAVPAILTGRRPIPDQVPSLADHPHNLFTVFGGSHRLWAQEPATQLCPPGLNSKIVVREPWAARFGSLASDLTIVYLHLLLPQTLSDHLPTISSAWGGFGRDDPPRPELSDAQPAERRTYFRRAVQATRGDRRVEIERLVEMAGKVSKSQLVFSHLMLPHRPWDLLPDGRRYPMGSQRSPGLSRSGWTGDEYLARQGLQRYILQTMYVDAEIGKLVDRLETAGRFDESLIVIVSDHGFSFVPGENQRLVSERNSYEILLVPMIIKAPHQTEGRVVNQLVSTLDILPTMLDILDEAPPWPVDGVSRAESAEVRPPAPLQIFNKKKGIIEVDPSILERRRRFVNTKLRLFGDGSDPQDVYRFGPYPDLCDRPIHELKMIEGMLWRVRIEGADAFDNVDLDAPTVPAYFRGSVFVRGAGGTTHNLAVALNGTVAATMTTYTAGNKRQRFSVMLPPSAFRQGENVVEVFSVIRRGGVPVLRPLPTN